MCRTIVCGVEGITLQEIFVFKQVNLLSLHRVDGIADDLLVFCEQIFHKAFIDY